MVNFSPSWQAFLVAFSAFGIYLTFPTANYSYDAIAYVGFIHRASFLGMDKNLWNEYHILYIPLGYLLEKTLLWLGWLVDVLFLMQVVNALLSAFSLFVFFKLVYAEIKNSSGTLIGVGLLAFSYSYWFYSTNPEVYPPTIFFLLLTFHYALRLARRNKTTLPLRDVLCAGLFSGLAFGFHVSSGLIVFMVLSAFLLQNSQKTFYWVELIKQGSVYLVIFILVALAPYYIRYHYYVNDSLITGMLGHAVYALHEEGPKEAKWFLGKGYNPLLELRGIQQGFSPAGGVLSQIFLLLIYLTILLQVKSLWIQFRKPAALLGIWAISYFLFFTAYNVGDIKFVPFQLVPTLFLFALALQTLIDFQALKDFRIFVKGFLGFGVGILAVMNFVGFIYPASQLENNLNYQKTLFIKDHTQPGDLIIHYGFGENLAQKVYLPYFSARDQLILDFILNSHTPLDALVYLDQQIIQRIAKGKQVFIFSELLENDSLIKKFHAERNLPVEKQSNRPLFKDFFLRYQPRLHAVFDEDFKLYVLSTK